jgi:hypothetical protein
VARMGVCRGIEEGNSVVAPGGFTPALPPMRTKSARSGPGSSAERKSLRPGGFMAQLKPCPFEVLVGVRWMVSFGVGRVWGDWYSHPTRDDETVMNGAPGWTQLPPSEVA